MKTLGNEVPGAYRAAVPHALVWTKSWRSIGQQSGRGKWMLTGGAAAGVSARLNGDRKIAGRLIERHQGLRVWGGRGPAGLQTHHRSSRK